MKKIAITVLLVALSQCGCIGVLRARRGQDSINEKGLCLSDPCWGQSNMTPLRAEHWDNRYGPGVRLTTEHYEVYTTLLNPFFLAKISDFVESAHRAYARQAAYEGKSERRSKIYIFKNRQQWEDFTKLMTGTQAGLFLKIRQGAFCYNDICVAYDIGPKRTLAALSHEGWHQFSSRHFRYRLPSWLDEGLAMQFEGFRSQGDQYLFLPSLNHYRKKALADVLIEQDSIPLEALLCTSPGEVMATDRAESVMAFYSQSYALVRFLQEADAGKYQTDYQQLIRDGLLGKWPLGVSDEAVAKRRDLPRTIDWNGRVGIQLFRAYVCNEIKSLEQEYLAFCWKIADESR